jgi:hypothetical protein
MSDNQAQQAFDLFASQYDTMGDKWQDMGADQYFIAGYNAALKAAAEREAQVRANVVAEEREKVKGLVEALAPLMHIVDRYNDSGLDEARPEWGDRNPVEVVLLTGRGGATLLTLDHCIAAVQAIATYNDNRKG